MRIFVISIAAAIVIAAGGAIVMTSLNPPVSEAYTTPSTRV